MPTAVPLEELRGANIGSSNKAARSADASERGAVVPTAAAVAVGGAAVQSATGSGNDRVDGSLPPVSF